MVNKHPAEVPAPLSCSVCSEYLLLVEYYCILKGKRLEKDNSSNIEIRIIYHVISAATVSPFILKYNLVGVI